MVEQIVRLYDRFIAPTHPATGEAAALLELVRGLDVASDGGDWREAVRTRDGFDPRLAVQGGRLVAASQRAIRFGFEPVSITRLRLVRTGESALQVAGVTVWGGGTNGVTSAK